MFSIELIVVLLTIFSCSCNKETSRFSTSGKIMTDKQLDIYKSKYITIKVKSLTFTYENDKVICNFKSHHVLSDKIFN